MVFSQTCWVALFLLGLAREGRHLVYLISALQSRRKILGFVLRRSISRSKSDLSIRVLQTHVYALA